jgi:methylated-DNA-[protein]-cysteine S-methyltransferase
MSSSTSTSTLLAERTHTVVASPIGPLTLVAEDGVLTGLELAPAVPRPVDPGSGVADPAGFGPVVEQLAAYFAGALTVFDVPIALRGTPFQQRVWAALQTIPHGETVSYGQLAARIGQPGASRAVGLANGRNPISIIVPCHRVIAAGGRLGGYGGGLDRKRFLLELEGTDLGALRP